MIHFLSFSMCDSFSSIRQSWILLKLPELSVVSHSDEISIKLWNRWNGTKNENVEWKPALPNLYNCHILFWKACPWHKHLLRHYDGRVILGWKYMCTFKADCALNLEFQRMVPKCFTAMYLNHFNSMTGSDLCRIDPWASPSEQYWEIS